MTLTSFPSWFITRSTLELNLKRHYKQASTEELGVWGLIAAFPLPLPGLSTKYNWASGPFVAIHIG